MTHFISYSRAAAIGFAIATFAPYQLAAAQSADSAAPVDAAADATADAAAAAASDVNSSADASAADASTSADTTADATIATGAESSASADAATSDVTIAPPAAGGQRSATDSAATTGADAQLDATAAGQANPPAQSTDPNAQPQSTNNNQTATPNDAQLRAGAEGEANATAQPQLGQPGANADVAANLGLQFGAATERGLTLNTIDRASVLASSGLRARDVIVSFSGQPVRSYADFQRYVTLYPAQRVPVIILRDGRQQTIYITAPAMSTAPLRSEAVARASLGVTFDSQVPNMAVVREVRPGSPAEHAGIRSGDVINALNGQRTATPQHVIDAVSRMQPGQEVQIDFARRSVVVLADNAPVRHSAGYAPQPSQPATAHTTIQPATPPTRVLVPADRPDAVVAPSADGRRLDSRDFDNDGDVIRPGDADRDGRVLDGDGRIRQRDND